MPAYEYIEIKYDQNGEIISEEKKIFKKVTQRDFIQVYLDDMSGLIGIKSLAEHQVLSWFWKFSQYPDDTFNCNYVSLSSLLFEKIQESTGLKPQSIRNTISTLSKKKILLKDEKRRGIYYLNPRFFWKGKLSENARNMQLNINYDITPNKDFDNQQSI